MTVAKKYIPKTLCVAGLFVFVSLMGCRTSAEQKVQNEPVDSAQNYYIQQQDEIIVQENFSDGLEYDMAQPYADQPYAEEPAYTNDLPPCYQVKNGQIAGMGKTSCAGRRNGLIQVPVNVMGASAAQKNMSPKAYSKTGSVVNIETPARCEITDRDNSIVSSIPMGSDSFKLVRMDKSDPLPRFEVNNYTFKQKPLDVALKNLLKEAGIRVYSDDGLFPEVSGENIRGELTAVIDELVAAGDAFYRYEANKKRLILSRWAPFMMKVPGGRIGMYTMLDALRGANITNLQADFGSNEIYVRVNYEKQKVITNLIKAIEQSPNLLLFDIQVYRLEPTTSKLDWQALVQDYGVTRISSSVNGIMGRILSVKPQKIRQTFVELLNKYAYVNLVSEGIAIMPSGWKVRFDIGQCALLESPEQKLSMLFQSNILSADRAESNIALDTPNGEITSFHTVYNMNDTLNIIAVKGKALNPQWTDNVEYIITLKPKLVRLVK